jgi:hypothetical protein
MRQKVLRFLAISCLLFLIGSSTASISQQKPLKVEVKVDTSKVFSFMPINVTLTTGVKKLFPTVQLQDYCIVAVMELYRIDSIKTITFPFAPVLDTVYTLNSHGIPDSIIITMQLMQRQAVTIQSSYYDFNWRRVSTPGRFLPDVPWFPIK